MPRLPQTGEESWGDVLNEYLLASHTADGATKGVAPAFNVKDFGAKGDGATDDTAAINSAIQAAAGGGIVFIPQGVFIADPGVGIILANSVTLQGAGHGSVLKVKNGSNVLNNFVKAELKSNITIRDLQIDGNRANQSSSDSQAVHYGIYIATSPNCRVQNVWVHHTTGVGVHIYNSAGTTVTNCVSSHNRYHGFECEQNTGCTFTGNRGHNNDRHGMFISPGEVGGSGSIGNVIDANSFDHNGEYGIAMGVAAGNGGSIGLTRDNVITNNSVFQNVWYGISVYVVDDTVIAHNSIVQNGAIGIHMYQAQRNQVVANRLHNNSQQGRGAYDELTIEGAGDGRPSKDNLIAYNYVLINGDKKAAWGIREATVSDGPNRITDNIIPAAGVMGTLTVKHESTSQGGLDLTTRQTATGLKTFGQGLAIGANSALPGGTMGLDAPFGNAALRMYSDVGNLQFVAPNGNLDVYLGGSNSFSVTPHQVIARKRLRLAGGGSPASQTAPGEPGEIAWDTHYIYVCVAPNTWHRSQLVGW